MKQIALFPEQAGTPVYPEYSYQPEYLKPGEWAALTAELHAEIEWEQHFVTLFGKVHACPRLSAWHGDSDARYRYSGNTLEPRPWTPCLAQLRDRLASDLGTPFNSVLLNLYRDGADSMGWHSDDEPELGPRPVIASVSLGARRKMRFRNRAGRSVTAEQWLDHGSLLVMHGSCQEQWHHSLPRSKRITEPRINLTFRRIRKG
jgi:alkylated DNA repair dioxygenase AlkB